MSGKEARALPNSNFESEAPLCLARENIRTQHLPNEWITKPAGIGLRAPEASLLYVKSVERSMPIDAGSPQILVPEIAGTNIGGPHI